MQIPVTTTFDIQGYRIKEALINSIKGVGARRKPTKKRSLHGVNEHFESISNAANSPSAD